MQKELQEKFERDFIQNVSNSTLVSRERERYRGAVQILWTPKSTNRRSSGNQQQTGDARHRAHGRHCPRRVQRGKHDQSKRPRV